MAQQCPECGAIWHHNETCRTYFDQMLYWEAEFPDYGVVHHLMVLCYHLQHPSLYSPETFAFGKQLLVDFIDKGITPQQTRKQNQDKLNSKNRKWKITGTDEAHGSYAHPIQWTMTAADVVAGGADHYCENVRAWAKSMLEEIKASGNLK